MDPHREKKLMKRVGLYEKFKYVGAENPLCARCFCILIKAYLLVVSEAYKTIICDRIYG